MLETSIFCFIIMLFLFIRCFYLKDLTRKSFLSYNHCNILKGIAAILIVVQHVGGVYGTRIFTPLGGIGVAIFLICSGYGLSKSYYRNGLDKFLFKRLSRVIIPYWYLVIVYNVINYQSFRITKFFLQILLLKPIPFMWFVQFIILTYILFYIIYTLIPQKQRILVFIIVGFFNLWLSRDQLWAEQSFSFIVGIFLSSLNTENLTYRKLFRLGWQFLFIGLISLLIKQIPEIREGNYIIMNVIQLSLKLSSAIGIICLSYVLMKYTFITVFNEIGKFSYEIYLIHTQLLFILNKNQWLTTMLIYIFICITFIYLLNKIVVLNFQKIKSIVMTLDLSQSFGHKKVKFLSSLSRKLLTFFRC